jgi:hypothetical protein
MISGQRGYTLSMSLKGNLRTFYLAQNGEHFSGCRAAFCKQPGYLGFTWIKIYAIKLDPIFGFISLKEISNAHRYRL